MTAAPDFETHVVQNQPPPFEPRDAWQSDLALREAIARETDGSFDARLATYGARVGDELHRLGVEANRDRPRLRTHDRFGHRIDTVEFNAAYHGLMDAAMTHGVAGLSWHAPAPGAHVARAALSYLHHQADAGTSCPLTMTHAAVPVLRREPALHAWAERAANPCYDAADIPMHGKRSVTLGMGMTEKQGGSDVRSNATTATPDGDAYRLIGHKWFFSAPMSDGFLVLAQAPGGLSCFLMPRRLDDGQLNAFQLMRLKDKLGDGSNASSEVEFRGARAWRIGDEGRGIATIIEMVMLTRLDCMVGSAAEMRLALAHALHHARHRRTFGKRLCEHPLMANVLADLAIESEAATALSMRVARAIDRAPSEPNEAAFARIATAIGKFWICKRAPAFVNEAQECLGGAGYVEESILPRLYRQAPLNSIWEGSGNIQCLDVLRALAREPESRHALDAALSAAMGRSNVFDAFVERLRADMPNAHEASARLLTEHLALALQAAILLRAGSPVADAFVRTRMQAGRGLVFGSVELGEAPDAFLQRALPA